MLDIEKIDAQVEKVLATPTVGKAQKMLQSRGGVWFIAVVSFVESALPIPILTDPFLVAGILLNRKKVVEITVVTILFSVLGGIFAYFSALLFLETILAFMPASLVSQFNEMVSNTQANTFVLTILGAITPVPYTLVAWAVAVLQGSLFVFIVASVLGRSVRYCIVSYCVYKFGPTAMRYARRYIGLTSLIVVLLGVAYFLHKM